MFSVAGRTFSLRATRPATLFTPIAVAWLALVANGIAITWQRSPQDAVPSVDIPILLVAGLAIADCLERLISLPPSLAHGGRVATLALSTLVLASAFLGPISMGILRWAAVAVGAPCAVMAWLTVRESMRLLRGRGAGTELAA